jgi:hypothetical protein
MYIMKSDESVASCEYDHNAFVHAHISTNKVRFHHKKYTAVGEELYVVATRSVVTQILLHGALEHDQEERR